MGKFKDIADDPEDRRITQIGEAMMDLPAGRMVAFITDADPPEKADRYIAKLLARFPDIRVVDKVDGPVTGTVTVRLTR